MSSIPCPVDGCSKNAHRKGFCYAHYMKDWRYGTPTPDHGPSWQDIRGKRFGNLTVTNQRIDNKWLCLCDCGAESQVRAGDLNRGSVSTCGNRSTHLRLDTAGYTAAHQRIRTDRGPAHTHKCVDCGEQASQWSYDHADTNELLGDVGSPRLCAYSLDPTHYDPRCVSCHKLFDLGRVAAFSA